MRGVWLDKAQLLEGVDACRARIARLADAGFNTLFVATQVRGCVIYPDSEFLPQYAPAKSHSPDLLRVIIEAAHARGLRVEAWTEFGFYTYWTQDAAKDASRGAVLDRHPELAAIDANGNALIHQPQYGDFYALCPANPRAQDLLIDLYVEMLERFPFDGLQLDRIRFPDARFCHCAYCRQRFEMDTGVALDQATADDASDVQKMQIDRWRKRQVNAFVERMALARRERFPTRSLTSAVVPPAMIDEKGQDWPVWLESGWLDGVAVMLYADKIAPSLDWIRERDPRGGPVWIGLDAAPGAERLISQIQESRASGFPGTVVWYSGTVDSLLPELRSAGLALPRDPSSHVQPVQPPSAVGDGSSKPEGKNGAD